MIITYDHCFCNLNKQFLSLIYIVLIGIIKSQTNCGTDCSLCDGNESGCGDSTQDCVWLPDPQICALKGTCRSACRFCTDFEECFNAGAGGGICQPILAATLTCFGPECETNCAACSSETLCINSQATPTGCTFIGGTTQECVDGAADVPTDNPTPVPTTNSPTSNPTEFS